MSISNDEARKRLERFTVEDPRYPVTVGVSPRGRLVQDLSQLHAGEATLDRAELSRRLDALKPRDRTKLFAKFAPDLAAALDRCWTTTAHAPYQTGWVRRPFRTSDPELSATRRLDTLTAGLDVGLRYRQGIEWCAHWVGRGVGGSEAFAAVLASEINHGNTRVRDVLRDSMLGRDEIGLPSLVGVIALLSSREPDDWHVVTDLLVSTQRQEGMRWTIIGPADFVGGDAFAHVLGVILEHGLTRFASTVQVAGTWFGDQFDIRGEKQLIAVLQRARELLAAPAVPVTPVGTTDTYLQLWCSAFRDVHAAVAQAQLLITSPDADVRLAVARFLSATQLEVRYDLLTPLYDDPDPRVAAAAITAFDVQVFIQSTTVVHPLDTSQITAMTTTMERLDKRAKLDIGVVSPAEITFGAADVANRIVQHAPAQLQFLTGPAFAKAGAPGRLHRAAMLTTNPRQNQAELLAMVGDASQDVRQRVGSALLDSDLDITPDQAAELQSLLTRKAPDLRRTCMELLRRQRPAALDQTIVALAAGDEQQRLAARELSSGNLPCPSGRTVEAAATSSQPAQRTELPEPLRVNHAARTPAVRPLPLPVPDGQHERCRVLYTSLNAWLSEHRDVEVDMGVTIMLLGDVKFFFQGRNTEAIPLEPIIGPWWERVEPTLTDGGLECALIAEYVGLATTNPDESASNLHRAARQVIGPNITRDPDHPLTFELLSAIATSRARPTWADPLLDAYATVLASVSVTKQDLRTARESDQVSRQPTWMGHASRLDHRQRLNEPPRILQRLLEQGELTREQLDRYWRLARYLDEPAGVHVPGVDPMRPSPMLATRLGVDLQHPDAQVPDQALRMPPEARLMATAYEAGVATSDDLTDALLVLPEQLASYRSSLQGALQRRAHHPWIAQAKQTVEHADRVMSAALDIEARRGEFDTRVSHLVSTLVATYGIETLVTYVSSLGRGRLVRGWSWVHGRESALSRVIRYTRPRPGDTVEQLAAALAKTKVKQSRIIELGMYSPQWAQLLEGVLDWPGFEDAVWWLHAHTKSGDWVVDQQLRDEWAAEVSRRTPLDAEDLVGGAVDVAWFASMHATLGSERFDTVLKAAKYASSSGGHKRAELFATTLLGRVAEDDLLNRIRGKRHQDSVRALGLLPLPDGTERDEAVLRRYEFLRAFVASDRTSGSGRRASESKAVHVGLENLARSAGYRDPQRLIWAMEAHATRDLASGPLVARDGDLAITLDIGDDGTPKLSVARGDKALKSVPKKSLAVPEVAALKDRVTILKKQRRRMVVSLEDACVTGETFTPAELAELLKHPMLRPMLQHLVLVTEEGVIGFGTETVDRLRDTSGQPLTTDGSGLRIAHPVDLLESGQWPDFQHALFTSQTKQPFKQLFRELYVPIASEGGGAIRSARYAGHQVEARRAGGLFKSRGWVADFEVGFVKTFHHERLTAACTLLYTFGTPGDVEDSTVEDVYFFRSGGAEPLGVQDVPPRVFSEVMRDLDLVVSVAHSSGVDPETSLSTVEMRARLVAETCDMLGLQNVELTDHHAIVQGTLATYSINLGSGLVHRQPGRAVCIIPISAQHRGRIFLPFADDDPRSAEVISKVVLLARDNTIKDPTILQQLA